MAAARSRPGCLEIVKQQTCRGAVGRQLIGVVLRFRVRFRTLADDCHGDFLGAARIATQFMKDCGINTEKSALGSSIDGVVVFGCLFQPGRAFRGVPRRRLRDQAARQAPQCFPRNDRRPMGDQFTCNRSPPPQLPRPSIGSGTRQVEDGAILQLAGVGILLEAKECRVAGSEIVAGTSRLADKCDQYSIGRKCSTGSATSIMLGTSQGPSDRNQLPQLLELLLTATPEERPSQ